MGAWAESEEEGEGEILQPTPRRVVFFFFPTPTISKIQHLGEYRTSSGRDGASVGWASGAGQGWDQDVAIKASTARAELKRTPKNPIIKISNILMPFKESK